jgi:hypothetical protein
VQEDAEIPDSMRLAVEAASGRYMLTGETRSFVADAMLETVDNIRPRGPPAGVRLSPPGVRHPG